MPPPQPPISSGPPSPAAVLARPDHRIYVTTGSHLMQEHPACDDLLERLDEILYRAAYRDGEPFTVAPPSMRHGMAAPYPSTCRLSLPSMKASFSARTSARYRRRMGRSGSVKPVRLRNVSPRAPRRKWAARPLRGLAVPKPRYDREHGSRPKSEACLEACCRAWPLNFIRTELQPLIFVCRLIACEMLSKHRGTVWTRLLPFWLWWALSSSWGTDLHSRVQQSQRPE